MVRSLNYRLRKNLKTDDDWDKELEVLDEINNIRKLRRECEDEEDDSDDEEELFGECAQPLSSRHLNF